MRKTKILLLLLIPSLAFAYQKPKDVIDMGTTNANSEGYRLWGSIGQVAVGKATSSHYTLNGGYISGSGIEAKEIFLLGPKTFSLSQNYPNPFNPVTQIKYALPRDCYVKLEVYNILGQRVASLVDGKQRAGYKTVRWDAGGFASGIYLYRLEVKGDGFEVTKTKKMILLK